MAKLYFRYAAMNAGKSTSLLQVAHNYEERGQTVHLFTSALDTRSGAGQIVSRLGVTRTVEVFTPETDFMAQYGRTHPDIHNARTRPSCILIDEAQFLSTLQVRQLHALANIEGVPVICYGLRSDFLGHAFPGSRALLTLADDMEEIKTICRCGRKATMNMRLDKERRRVTEGDQIEVGGNDRYEAVCPKRFYTGQC